MQYHGEINTHMDEISIFAENPGKVQLAKHRAQSCVFISVVDRNGAVIILLMFDDVIISVYFGGFFCLM